MKQKIAQNPSEKVEAIINHNSIAKFIALKIGSEKNQKNVLVSLPLEYHAEIRKAYSKMVKKPNEICGGGRLVIDRKRHKIKVYGHSGDYGLYDKAMVEGILEVTHPKFKIEVRKSSFKEY